MREVELVALDDPEAFCTRLLSPPWRGAAAPDDEASQTDLECEFLRTRCEAALLGEEVAGLAFPPFAVDGEDLSPALRA